MSLIKKEIEINNMKIEELLKEVKEWEEHNKRENDITRAEIKSLKKINNKLRKAI